jgi:proteasome lid subunit RPN8/RPN11
MPDQNPQYAAQITITLPSEQRSVSLIVTLLPADLVEVGGVVKPLSHCTLADLERYAAELEADVWDTYDSIVLPELSADERVDLDIRLLDGEGDETTDWRSLNLLLPAELAYETGEVETASEVEQDEPEPESLPTAEVEMQGEPLAAVQTPAAEEAAGKDASHTAPDVAVAPEEPVYPEIEEEVAGEAAPAHIVDSRARVRVAGGRLPLNDPTWTAVDILVDEPALRAAQAHALSSMHREVAGVLVGGRPEKQPDGRYVVHVFDTIVARHTVMQGASVTYTPESWRYLNDTLAERYPDETAVMVGWYHTHPGFGIFLSGMDLFIHQNFFTQIWHVAFVLDPQARTSGFFCWDRQKTRVGRCDFAWPPWAAGSW